MTIILDKIKQPWETKDYDALYSEWLPTGDTLETATVTVIERDDPAATSTLLVESTDIGQAYVKVWLTGGTDGTIYLVTIRATTVGGRGVECEMVIRVKDQG